MKRITLSNDFHDTEVALHIDKNGYVSNGQMKRARRELCGIQGCTCSSPFGYRGHQSDIEEIELHFDGYVQKECGRVVFKNEEE